jgi:hypothetical protein
MLSPGYCDPGNMMQWFILLISMSVPLHKILEFCKEGKRDICLIQLLTERLQAYFDWHPTMFHKQYIMSTLYGALGFCGKSWCGLSFAAPC